MNNRAEELKSILGFDPRDVLTFSALKTSEELKNALGFDPREGCTFRASAPAIISAAGISGLAASPDDALARINASPYVKTQLSTDDVYLHTLEAASTRFISDRFAFLSERTVQNIAKDATAGFSFMTRHATGGWSGDGENPYGRTFAGAVDTTGDGIKRAVVQVYMLRDHKPNGMSATSTDDLNKGMVGGTLFDASVGLKRSADIKYTCDICQDDLFGDDCGHIPGSTYSMSPEDIAKQKSRGVPGGVCTYTIDNAHAGEISMVFDGAISGAGTFATTNASSNQKPTAQAVSEGTMYSKELKLKLGLLETATDAEVETKLATLNAAATENESLKANAKKNADAAFEAKYKTALGEDLFATVKDLANRDAVAEKLAAGLTAKEATATPPVGDILSGAAAAAAAGVPAVHTTEPNGLFHVESESIRKKFGKFASSADLDKAAMTSPLAAIVKVLGYKGIIPDEFRTMDEQALAHRAARFLTTYKPAAA